MHHYVGVCALQVVMHYCQVGVAAQHARYAVGEYEEFPWLGALFQLVAYIRMGVCDRTRVLEGVEMPDLRPLLDQLPLPWKQRLEQVIREELAGQSVHPSPEVLAEVRALTTLPPLLSATTQPQLRRGHSA